jgi:hypothetical protein
LATVSCAEAADIPEEADVEDGVATEDGIAADAGDGMSVAALLVAVSGTSEGSALAEPAMAPAGVAAFAELISEGGPLSAQTGPGKPKKTPPAARLASVEAIKASLIVRNK